MISLATLPKATAQEVFNQVATHLLTQKKRAADDPDATFPACKYRAGNLKCAAGCLISDEEYRPEFEGNTWSDLVSGFSRTFSSAHKELIRRLQDVHDYNRVQDWKESLSSVAYRFNLDNSILNEYN